MFLKRLKENSNKKYIKGLLSEREVSVKKITINSIAVLINCDVFTNTQFFEIIAEEFGVKSHKLQIIPYSLENKTTKLHNSTCFNFKDFGWRGHIKNPELERLIKQKYDLLINYYITNDVYLQVLSACSPAQLKIGLAHPDLNDILIQTELQQTDEFKTELFKYLKTLF